MARSPNTCENFHSSGGNGATAAAAAPPGGEPAAAAPLAPLIIAATCTPLHSTRAAILLLDLPLYPTLSLPAPNPNLYHIERALRIGSRSSFNAMASALRVP
jgi:hypothetical protein